MGYQPETGCRRIKDWETPNTHKGPVLRCSGGGHRYTNLHRPRTNRQRITEEVL
jgi:hypothetical protein